jgi:hypothetical protein
LNFWPKKGRCGADIPMPDDGLASLAAHRSRYRSD